MPATRSLALVSIPGLLLAISCGGGDSPTEPTNPKAAVPPATAKPTTASPGSKTPTGAAHGRIFFATAAGGGMSISTDKDDYAPGDTVRLTGAGWTANDTLDVLLTVDPTGAKHTWTIAVAGDGTFADSTYVVDATDLNGTFTLTVTSKSNPTQTLTVVFTDANPQVNTITLSPTVPAAGQAFTASFTVTNAGNAGNAVPWRATGWRVYPKNTTPGDITCVNSPDFTVSGTSPTFTLNLPALAIGGDYSLDIETFSDDGTTCHELVGAGKSMNFSVTGTPDLTIAKTHTGNFTAGGSASYSIVVSNSGTLVTSGGISVVDTMPAAFTTPSGAGSAWACSTAGQIVTCTRGGGVNAIAAGASAPAITITATAGAPATVTNRAWVSGGSEPDANKGNNGASDPTTIVASTVPTTTSLQASANPSVFGQSVTFTATVKVTATNAAVTTGTLAIFEGTSCASIPASPIASGTPSASGQVSGAASLAVGMHGLIACYLGASGFDPSDGTLAYTVNRAATSTGVTSSANPSVFSQPVTFGVTVTVTAPGSGTPAGAVTLKDGTCAAGIALDGPTNLSGGQATFSNISSLSVATHTITACYGGNTDFAPSDGTVSQVVNKASTTTEVTSSANPSVYSQTVTFSVTVKPVAPALATPDGSIALKDGTCAAGTSVGSGTLDANGQASFDVSDLAVGAHTITACYAGTTNFEASDGSLSQQVNKAQTSTAVVSSVNPSKLGQPVTFTVTVTPVSPAVATPQGSATLYDGSCSATSVGGPTALNASGQVSFNVSSLSVGLHTVTGCYGGNSNFEGSSGHVDQRVDYNFEGLFAPVDRPNTMNLSKAGQGVPLKWRLTDYYGAPVLNFSGTTLGVAVTGLNCAVSATLDQIEDYAGNSGLQNLGDGYYQFNWKTPGTYANTCKALGLNLGEGSGARGPLAYFNFKK